MNLEKKFQKFISENQLFTKQNKLLVGFSGGPDSVALAHLLLKTGYNFALAHVNFKLRGKEADQDQIFTQNFAKKYNLQLFETQFNTSQYAQQNKISIELAARQLRYNWFYELINKHNFNYILTAHNADDNVETILNNLARGTGLKGLLGIPLKNNLIRRPLLFAFKDEILQYLKQNNLQFRIDSTNLKPIYTRNIIRLQIIPNFEKIYPAFKQNVLNTAKILHQYWLFVQKNLQKIIDNAISKQNQYIYINKKLIPEEFKQLILFELLYDYNFTPDQISQIANSFNSQPGKLFFSPNYVLLNDRNHLIITNLNNFQKPTQTYQITPDTKLIQTPYFDLKLQIIPYSPNIQLKQPPNIALINYDKLKFPLILRPWKDGDYFFPFGMNNAKKLSDFFVNLKINIFEKNKIYVLQNADNKIIWIVGYRLDNRFKITNNTTKILKIEMIKK